MKKYKILSAFGLYASFLFIGHHGPLSAHAHAAHPLVLAGPETQVSTVQAAIAPEGPQVLGASTSAQPQVLFYNPLYGTYEPTPSLLKDDEMEKLQLCITSQESRDMAAFEKCYASLYPKGIVLDNGHTHKKHALKMIKRDDEQLVRHMKARKFQPHYA